MCPGRECESLAESRRTRCMESSALDGRVGRYRRQMDKEERAIQILQREDAMVRAILSVSLLEVPASILVRSSEKCTSASVDITV